MTTANDNTGPVTAEALLVDNGIDARWVTEALNDVGIDGTVSSMDAVLVGTGQVGENVRCRLRWESLPDADADRPDSLVVKLASSNEKSRAAAAATRTYIREVGFYRDVSASVAIRVPRVYALSEDRGANRFVLAMEDIAPSVPGDQLSGCTLDQAAMAVEAAADLHGSTWGRGELAELDWVDTPSPERTKDRIDLFAALYPGFEAAYRDRLDEAELAFGRWLAANFGRWTRSRSIEDPGTADCLIHGDFRLDNLLFGTGSPAPGLTTVDWQTASLGGGLSDVAYFLSGSLDAATLRDREGEFLARYRDRLATHGVVLSEEAVWHGYRLAAPAGYVMAVIASQLVGRTERGDEMFLVMAKGSAAQAVQLDTASLLD